MKKTDKKQRTVRMVTMDICHHGVTYSRFHYRTKDHDHIIIQSGIKNEDGEWLGLTLPNDTNINVNIFFYKGRWLSSCERCDYIQDYGWDHHFDPEITATNIRVYYNRCNN